MRTAYHEQLDALTDQLGEMCGLAGVAMERATQALLQADLVLAEQVITDHEQMTTMSAKAEESAFVLLALQAPVAGDLRAIVSSIQIVADVDRMGALALHVAKIARRRHPQHALPEEVNGYFAEMGRVQSNWAIAPRRCCHAIRRKPHGSAKKTTQWTTCTVTCSRADGPGVEVRGRRGRRRDAAGPLLRAVRRPCRRDSSPRHLPGHRQAPRRGRSPPR